MPPVRNPLVLARLALAVAGRPVAQWAPPEPLPEDVPRRAALTTDVTLWRLPVGFVRVRQRHRELEPELWGAPDGFRFPLMMADTRLTEWLPCTAWLIEHPEGAILVDTGASPRFGKADWDGVGRVGRRLYPRIIECRVPPGSGLGAALSAVGIGVRDVRTCVLTHLHSDHVDNVADLGAGTRLVLSERETRDTRGSGRLPGRLPRDGRVVFTDALPAAPVPAAEGARALTARGDVQVIPLPGHTPGHSGVLVDCGAHQVLIAGDAAFDDSQVRRGAIPGINEDRADTLLSHERIRALSAARPTTMLYSHSDGLPASELGDVATARLCCRDVAQTEEREVVAQDPHAFGRSPSPEAPDD